MLGVSRIVLKECNVGDTIPRNLLKFPEMMESGIYLVGWSSIRLGTVTNDPPCFGSVYTTLSRRLYKMYVQNKTEITWM